MGTRIVEKAVSILMPNLNQVKYISLAIESIIAQTYEKWELLIIDGGSTDGSYEVAQQYAGKDERISLFLKQGMKVSASLNFGITEARGRYLCYFHSDDIMCPRNLEVKVGRLRRDPSIGLIHSPVFRIDEHGNVYCIISLPEAKNPFFAQFMNTSYIHSGSVLFKKILVEKAGSGFNENLVYVNDHDMWLTLAGITKVCFLPIPLTKSRKHSGTLTSRLRKELCEEEKKNVWLHHLNQVQADRLFKDVAGKENRNVRFREMFTYFYNNKQMCVCDALLKQVGDKSLSSFEQKVCSILLGRRSVGKAEFTGMVLRVWLSFFDLLRCAQAGIFLGQHGLFTMRKGFRLPPCIVVWHMAPEEKVNKVYELLEKGEGRKHHIVSVMHASKKSRRHTCKGKRTVLTYRDTVLNEKAGTLLSRALLDTDALHIIVAHGERFDAYANVEAIVHACSPRFVIKTDPDVRSEFLAVSEKI
jgi:glycosyltransferase involved in cell wall biosynthesis